MVASGSFEAVRRMDSSRVHRQQVSARGSALFRTVGRSRNPTSWQSCMPTTTGHHGKEQCDFKPLSGRCRLVMLVMPDEGAPLSGPAGRVLYSIRRRRGPGECSRSNPQSTDSPG